MLNSSTDTLASNACPLTSMIWLSMIIYISLGIFTRKSWNFTRLTSSWDRSIVWGTYVSFPVPCRGYMTCESHTGIVIHIDKSKKSRTLRPNVQVNVLLLWGKWENGMLSDCFLWPALVEPFNLMNVERHVCRTSSRKSTWPFDPSVQDKVKSFWQCGGEPKVL